MPAEINAIISANPPLRRSPQGFHPGFGDSPQAGPAVFGGWGKGWGGGEGGVPQCRRSTLGPC